MCAVRLLFTSFTLCSVKITFCAMFIIAFRPPKYTIARILFREWMQTSSKSKMNKVYLLFSRVKSGTCIYICIRPYRYCSEIIVYKLCCYCFNGFMVILVSVLYYKIVIHAQSPQLYSNKVNRFVDVYINVFMIFIRCWA